MAVMTYVFWGNEVFQAIASFECPFPASLNRDAGGPKYQILHIQVRYLLYEVLNYFKGNVEGSGPEQCCDNTVGFFLALQYMTLLFNCRSCNVTIFGSVIVV
jgi:hypothetical protein